MEHPRVAIAASRNFGKAVERNRAKRVLRAALAPFLSELKPGYDLILVARRQGLPAKSPEMQAIVKLLLQKAKLLI